jgi:hypothetical protein
VTGTTLGTTVGCWAALDVRVHQHRRLGHEDRIAEQRHRGTQPGGGAVHLGDDRLFQVEEREDDFFCLGHDRFEQGGLVDGFLHPGDVAARRERPSGAGQHHHVAVGIALGEAENLRQILVHARVDGVHLIRAV